MDQRVAEVIAAIYNTVRNPKKRVKPYRGSDFLPKQEEDKPQSGKQMEAILRSVLH